MVLPDKGRAEPFENSVVPMAGGDGAPGDKWHQTGKDDGGGGMGHLDSEFPSGRRGPPPPREKEEGEEEREGSGGISPLQPPLLHEGGAGGGPATRQKSLGQEVFTPSAHLTPVGDMENPFVVQDLTVTPSTPTEKGTKGEFQDQGLRAAQQQHMAVNVEGSPIPSGDPWSRKVSEMTVEAMNERRWREALDGVRQELSHASEARGGLFDKTSFVAALRSKEVTARWFSLHDVEGRGFLQQQQWIERSKANSRDEATQEWTELLEVLAYIVCGEEGVITQEIFARIITSKKVLESLFGLLKKTPEGLVNRQEVMDFLSAYTYNRPRTGFTKENLECLEQLFRQALGKKDELGFEDFKKIVRSKNPFFARRVFQIFDRDNSDTVSLTEFLDAIHQYVGQSPEDKIKFLFKVYDLDGDGMITEDELQEVLRACMHESGVSFSEEHIGDMTDALFEDAGVDENDAITYEGLKAQLEKHDGLIENLSISIDRWLVPPEPVCSAKPSLWNRLRKLHPYQMTLPYIKNNYVYLGFLIAYIIVNLALFIARVREYIEANTYTILARGCGQLLNFNCVFVLVLMLRQSITFLRTHGAAAYLPLDQHLYLHKMVGCVIFILSLVHTLAHLCNFSLVIQPNSNYTLAEWLLTSRPGKFGLVEGVANPTGVALIIILTIMVICSMPFVRKSGYFEVFYWTHLLYIAFWILTIFHGPKFWMWFVGPGLIFLIERFVRIVNMRTGHGKTYISSGALLPSRVTHLVIKRPTQFDFHPGDYGFVNIPAIAKYEWHPFTFSSAPEHHDVIWLHVRAVGEWTKRLYDYFEKEQQRCEAQLSQVEGSSSRRSRISRLSHQSDHSNVDAGDKCPSKETGPPTGKELGVGNPAFDPDPDMVQLPNTMSPAPVIPVRTILKNPSAPNLLVSVRKQPLDKSQSVPDFGRRVKKREKQFIMRNLMRAKSDHGFDEGALTSARRLARNNVSFLTNPANKSLAHSFRYMRRKPAIINLELPDEDEADDNEEDESPTGIGTTELESVDISTAWNDILPDEEDVAARVARREGARRKRKSRLISRRQLAKEQAAEEGICLPGESLVIYVDGPYGAPSSHIFRAQHAVLIGTGIGVTPFASILQSIMHKYWKAKHVCPKCEYSWTNDIPASVMNLRKVDFFWINRDQRSFEWFVNLLSQLEIEQAEQGGSLDRFLDMHMYITSALQKTDMKAVGLQLALDLLHEREKRDLITGLKTRTNAGRPNWDKVFRQLSNMKKGKITVFYCGPPALARVLRFKCDEYGFDFRKEIF